jgi:hypothetical protein
MEHFEWLQGKADIKWSKLIDPYDGVLSKRFCLAFFPELSDLIEPYNELATITYRSLSEFVHGNSETWAKSGIVLKYNNALKQEYFSLFKTTGELILITLSCRYLKSINSDNFDSIEFITTELNHIAPIRELLGGPKELK